MIFQWERLNERLALIAHKACTRYFSFKTERLLLHLQRTLLLNCCLQSIIYRFNRTTRHIQHYTVYVIYWFLIFFFVAALFVTTCVVITIQFCVSRFNVKSHSFHTFVSIVSRFEVHTYSCEKRIYLQKISVVRARKTILRIDVLVLRDYFAWMKSSQLCLFKSWLWNTWFIRLFPFSRLFHCC